MDGIDKNTAIDTDKTGNLIVMYERKFNDIKDIPVTYFEIGVFHGGSLVWADNYFKNPLSKIYGMDKYLGNVPWGSSDRITLLECNQNDSDKLQTYGKTFGKFDIIIDDGSHMAKETMNCFINLWPYLNNGGWYIIEDWGACYSTYSDAGNNYSGMDNIISNILLLTREYGISGIEIILGGKEGTYAAFKKR